MIGFFIKKAFFDGWDNFIGMVLQNLIYIVLFGCLLATTYLMEISFGIFLLGVAVVFLILCIFFGGTSQTVYGYSNYEKETWEPFGKGIRRNIRHSILFYIVSLLIFMVFFVVIPFYISSGNMVGLILGVFMGWVAIIVLLALPYYFPLMTLLPGDRPLKTFKKCFIILSDNLAFSFFFLLYNVVIIAFTVLTMGLIPGVAGYMLASEDAMKLLMYKYDYKELHPDVKNKDIPWHELLYDEKEKIGPRSFRSMIFPWKY